MAFNIVNKIDDRVAIKNVLISLFDKTGLEPLVNGLIKSCPDVKIFSTGGTYKAIETILGDKASKHLVSVSDYTGQPEMQGGLVKTLDFKIYLGILGEKYNDAHQADLARTNAVAFDMVVVNLYPFCEAIAKPDVTPELARTNIDIGGPCMIRASAKNFIRVASVTDTNDYPEILEELSNNNGTLSLATRAKLMAKAFAHTASYDTAIANHFAKLNPESIADTYAEVIK